MRSSCATVTSTSAWWTSPERRKRGGPPFDNHAERHHQGLDNRLIEPDETAARSDGPIACRERIGGMLRYYYRQAA